MDPNNEFIEVENRIRALTTILKNLNYHITPSSDPKDVPSFLRHFANLLTIGDRKCPEAKKVVAVTGSLLPGGKMNTLVVTQNPFSKSGVKNLCIKDVSKSEKSFDEIVDLKRDDNVVLTEYISDLWAALTYYQSAPNRYADLHIFVVYRSYRKLFKRVRQDMETWKVHVAKDILAWTPKSKELRKGPQWFEFPDWLDTLVIPPGRLQMLKTRKRGTPGKEFIEVEFSNATVTFWAWLLGRSLLNLEDIVDMADKKRKHDVEGFKKDLAVIADWCFTLHRYVNWSARIVETLLTETSLSSVFSLPQRSDALGDDGDNNAGHNKNTDDVHNADADEDDENADDDLADMSRETSESDGHLVLRHLRAMLSWSAALDSLTSPKHLSIINGKLDIGLVQVPHAGHDIARIEDIIDEFFKRFPLRSIEESGRTQDTANLKRGWNSKHKFTGTTHAEASLMGLLTYFSEPNPLRRVDHWNALEDPKIAQRMEALIGPTAVTNKVIGVGKKCCWCCSTLGSILSQDKHISIKLPGSHGIIYPWSPPRVGLDLSVLQILEEKLWDALYTAIDKAEFGVPLSRQTSGSSSVGDEDAPKKYFYTVAKRVME